MTDSLPPLDEDGYLRNADDWTEAVAALLAEREQLKLSTHHLQVCTCLRQFHQRFETEPSHRALAAFISVELGADFASSSQLALLFPGGVLRQASLLAGLSKPKHCL